MKQKNLFKIFLFLILTTFSFNMNGQIISQYIETNVGSHPKGIEIWNNTAGTLDFSVNNLVIEKGVNGQSPNPDYTLSSGTLAAGAVIVIGSDNLQATTESNGSTFYVKSFSFNGDDALVVKYGATTTDVFGNPGSDPGSHWNNNDVSTKNNNISLKDGITTGDTDGWTDPSIRFETTANGSTPTGFGIAPAAAASTVTWDGSDSSDWANGANWDSNAVPIATDNVIIPDVTTTPIIGATTGAVTNDLTITEPDGINITAGGSLIVSGTSTGNVTYNRTLDFVSGNANGWHLISSPVAAQTYNAAYATTNSLANSGTKRGLAFYNDALASGSKYTYLLSDDSNTSSFNTGVYSGSGIGYSAKRASTTGTVAFTGTINTDDVNGVAVSTSGDGFNLLGVPYTSYISSQTFLTDNSNLEQTQIWVWEQGVTGGNFIAMTAKADNFILAPGQGFFVKAASGTAVNFAETNQTANADTFLKSSRTEVKLLINDGESNRFAKVYFLNNVTKGFDSGYEGETFGGIKNSLDLFSQLVEGNQGKKYQVQSLPESDLESMVIPIGVIADAGKEITFTADAVNLSSGLKVFLEDRQTNIFTRLDEANSEYKITLTETLNGVGRFYMHTTASVLSTEDIILNSVRIFKTDSSTLKITGLPKGKTSFYLYNILGKEMMTTIFTSNGNKEISLSKLASGIYLAKIQTEKGAISKKIILE